MTPEPIKEEDVKNTLTDGTNASCSVSVWFGGRGAERSQPTGDRT